MGLNVQNWSDKQLDELNDLIGTADFSSVAGFIVKNFLAMDPNPNTSPVLATDSGRIIADNSSNDNQPLRVLASGTMATINPGVFIHKGKVGQIDTLTSINILGTGGTYGVGQAAHATLKRYSIVQIRVSELAHTPALRWFVNDTVDPNTYSQQQTNTLINKAYPDITVKHGTNAASPTVPSTDSGYWCIAEIYIPAAVTALSDSGVVIRDTVTYSSAISPPNWTDPANPPPFQTRVTRLEFWSNLFGIDHHLTGSNAGHHRQGVWSIDATAVTATGAQINQALSGLIVPGTVTSDNLKQLTDGSVTALHSHSGGGGVTYPFTYDHDETVGWHKLGFSINNVPTSNNVTASNLNTLTAGSSSDASSLHKHGNLGFSYATQVDTVDVTVTGATYADVSTISGFTGSGVYSVMFTGEYRNSAYSALGTVKIVVDGGDISPTYVIQDNALTAGSYSARTVHQVISLSSGSHTIKIQGAALAGPGYNISFKNRRLTVSKIGD